MIGHFVPCTLIIREIKSMETAHNTELMEKETHEMTTLTAQVITNASTFELQLYCFYGQLCCIVASKLRILPTFTGKRINSGSITNLDGLLEAERRLFLLAQTDSFLAVKKNCLNSSLSARLQYS